MRNKTYRNDRRVRLGIVAVVKHGWCRHRVHAVPQAEMEFELGPACLGPDVKNDAIGLKFVALDRAGFSCRLQRFPVYLGTGWQSDFGEHHSIAAKPRNPTRSASTWHFNASSGLGSVWSYSTFMRSARVSPEIKFSPAVESPSRECSAR